MEQSERSASPAFLKHARPADFARCRNMARRALKTKADGETRHFPSKEALPQCTVGAPLGSQRPTRRGQGSPLAGPALFRHPPCTAPDIHHPRCFPLCRPHQPEVIPRRGPLNTHRPPRPNPSLLLPCEATKVTCTPHHSQFIPLSNGQRQPGSLEIPRSGPGDPPPFSRQSTQLKRPKPSSHPTVSCRRRPGHRHLSGQPTLHYQTPAFLSSDLPRAQPTRLHITIGI
ncbi:uncharacterized protein B0T23DRAFT_108666 [Neurospora hispaniola]|uniref:Uncharacterized protein n=1 Tax=Neurospora hispaniola TaxID=588809 RepID=A0AAJ0I9M4_9PEZI|nr:hypothetical protein B0T23DRAFT_108666 [Neurospora hispaniola]